MSEIINGSGKAEKKPPVIEYKKFDGRCNKLIGNIFAPERCENGATHKIIFSDGSYGYSCKLHIPKSGWKSWRGHVFVEAVAL